MILNGSIFVMNTEQKADVSVRAMIGQTKGNDDDEGNT